MEFEVSQGSDCQVLLNGVAKLIDLIDVKKKPFNTLEGLKKYVNRLVFTNIYHVKQIGEVSYYNADILNKTITISFNQLWLINACIMTKLIEQLDMELLLLNLDTFYIYRTMHEKSVISKFRFNKETEEIFFTRSELVIGTYDAISSAIDVYESSNVFKIEGSSYQFTGIPDSLLKPLIFHLSVLIQLKEST